MIQDENDGFQPRILEIGPIPYMHSAFPNTTDFYSTWLDETHSDPLRGRHIVTLATMPSLVHRLADPAYDLVVVQSVQYAPWTIRSLSRAIFRRSALRGQMPVVRSFGLQLLRGRVAAPIAIVDLDDPPVIDHANTFLLDKATVYFKRELPPDHWNVFNGTLHWRVPTPRFRMNRLHRARIAKLMPLSLGVSFSVLEREIPAPTRANEKTADVFFAGRVTGSSTVRESGLEELLALRREGYIIDVPEQPLFPEEYLARCAAAWLVWSPAGYGWQCFRTYESALCSSVPLLNRPTIAQCRPFIDGEQAYYYDVEQGGLSRVIRAALSDKNRLLIMAAAAHSHVLAHHMPTQIARYIAETTLQRADMQRADMQRQKFSVGQ